MLDWTQQQLADEAGVGLSTVRALEAARAGATFNGTASTAMQKALERHGVEFVTATADFGPGVRLSAQHPNIIRKPTKLNPREELPFAVEWRNRATIVFLPRSVLDDLDGARKRRTDAEYVASFNKHRNVVLSATQRCIDASRVTPDDRLFLKPEDFPDLWKF